MDAGRNTKTTDLRSWPFGGHRHDRHAYRIRFFLTRNNAVRHLALVRARCNCVNADWDSSEGKLGREHPGKVRSSCLGTVVTELKSRQDQVGNSRKREKKVNSAHVSAQP